MESVPQALERDHIFSLAARLNSGPYRDRRRAYFYRALLSRRGF